MTDAPKWRLIAQTLAAGIGPSGLRPGDRLRTEAQLAAEHGVNRHTIRRAIDSLVRMGLVRTEQGRGSFVAEDRLDYAVQPRTRFNEWIRRQNREPTGDVLQVRSLDAPVRIATGLGIEPGRPVALMERLGRADTVPISLAQHFFALDRHPDILAALRFEPTITAALAAVGVMDYVRRVTRVTARMPTAAEATLLQIPRTRPVLAGENTNVDPAGGIVEFGLSVYPSSRVQMVFEP